MTVSGENRENEGYLANEWVPVKSKKKTKLLIMLREN